MTKAEDFRLAVISDIHLGSKRNRSSDIIENLDKYLLDDKKNKDLDMLFIAGDLFDTLLTMQDDSASSILLWFSRLFCFCERHNIKLRALEGTPSHDRMQSTHLDNVAKIRHSKLDFKYIKALSIEHIDQYNIDILYVPDEWDHDPNNTLTQVYDLMASRGIKQVDFAIMHGNFHYQLPKAAKHLPAHDAQAYLSIVKHYIFIGHIHTFSKYKKIIAQGSFDRLSHNEEEPKGYVKAQVNLHTSEKHFFFIENKGARVYKTLDVNGFDLQDALNFISNQVKDFPLNAAVRISAQKSNPIFSNFHEVMSICPTFVWTKHVVEEQQEIQKEEELFDEFPDFTPITIHRENILDMVLDRLKHGTDNQTIDHCRELLKQIIEE